MGGSASSLRKRAFSAYEDYALPPAKRMKRTGGSTSSHQNDVIDVNDEAERHSAVSNVEREAVSTRPAEVLLRQELIIVKRHSLDLEQKLLNMEQQLAMKEDMLQSERRATREAEKLLKSQAPSMPLEEPEKSELEKSVSDLRKQLEQEREERQRANEKITELTNQLEKERERANEKITELTNELEKEKGRPDERIDELKRKLATYESTKKVRDIMDKIAERKIKPRIDNIADKNNIICLLNPKAKHSMPLDEAVEMVRTAFQKCGEKAKERCEDNFIFYDCDVCGVELRNKWVVTTHFLSQEHIEKVRPHNASISSIAVYDWVNTLKNVNRSK